MRRSGLFLIELILALLFFSVTSAVCMQIFGTSAVMVEQKEDRDAAVDASVNAAECLKAAGGDLAGAAKLLEAAALLGNGAAVSDGVLTQPCGDALTLTVAVTREERNAVFCTADVTDEAGKLVHSMEISARKKSFPSTKIRHCTRYLNPPIRRCAFCAGKPFTREIGLPMTTFSSGT